jgi:putative restriction endonuclease
MKFYVGVTDGEWFRFLSERKPTEVNFWRPMARTEFRAIELGAPFLFKLHKPEHAIVGGGFFAGYHRMPMSTA